MKIHWFSPLPPSSSEVAAYTARVLPYLADRAEVTLWTDQPDWAREVERYAAVQPYQPGRVPWTLLNRGGIAFYHLADEAACGALRGVSRQHPGIVVLHAPGSRPVASDAPVLTNLTGGPLELPATCDYVVLPRSRPGMGEDERTAVEAHVAVVLDLALSAEGCWSRSLAPAVASWVGSALHSWGGDQRLETFREGVADELHRLFTEHPGQGLPTTAKDATWEEANPETRRVA